MLSVRSLFRALFWTVLALPVHGQSAGAQTPLEQLFDPRTALSIILEMSQTTWNQIASAQPAAFTQTRFRFIPHGVDQIFDVAVKPNVYQTSVIAQLAYQNDGLRYQLIRTLASM